MQIYAFTDGSCKKSKQNAVIGGVGVYFHKYNNYNISKQMSIFNDALPTNQRMELLAILYAVKIFIKKFNLAEDSLTVVSDSMYSIKCITEWAKQWDDTDVWDKKKNTDLIKPLYELTKKHNIKFLHTNSHTKEPTKNTFEWFLWYGNKNADKLAGG